MRILRHLQLSAAPALFRCACALVVLALAGCASTGDAGIPISVPVSVGCVGELPARPVNTFGAGAYPGDKAAAQAALIDAAAWEGYATKLEVIIAGCPQIVEPGGLKGVTFRYPLQWSPVR